MLKLKKTKKVSFVRRLGSLFYRKLAYWNRLTIEADRDKKLKTALKSVGENFECCDEVTFSHLECVEIGDWVYIGPKGQFFSSGGLKIESHCIFGPEVSIMTSMHNYKGARLIPYDEYELLKPVTIGVASWIGMRAIIMPGVTLGAGCIVGSGSVVTKSFEGGCIIAGNPAVCIGHRDMDDFNEKLKDGDTYLSVKSEKNLKKVNLPS